MEVLGKVKVINAEQQVSASFKKRELVVTTDEQYPQHIMIEFTQDKCDILNNYSAGDAVKVSINLRGREWNGPQGIKFFNTLEAWRIEKVAAGSSNAAPAQNAQMPQSTAAPVFNSNVADNDDLPF